MSGLEVPLAGGLKILSWVTCVGLGSKVAIGVKCEFGHDGRA